MAGGYGGSVAASWQWRESGLRPKGAAPPARVLQEAAEDNLVRKERLQERHCEVPGIPRSTFLMVFSPDGTKVASTHGNHNVYVSELSTGKHVKTFSGHPRTPWCVAFHPSHTQLLASGCLGGQVRVWDLSGGSEVWTVGTETVIASIAFHPRDHLLVIATFNELHFWDWNQPTPFTSVQTNSIKAKVRFVAFDALGHKLITGISCWTCPVPPTSIVQPVPYLPPENASSRIAPGASSHEQIVSSYHHLVQRYDSLVRNYHHLIMGRSQMANTIDRGTDPMEVDWSPNLSSSTRSQSTNTSLYSNANVNGNIESTSQNTTINNQPSTSRQPHSSDSSVPISSNNSQETNTQPVVAELVPSTSHSAFQPVSSSANTESVNAQASASTSLLRDTPSQNNGPNQVMRNELTASLNRLQGFMENSIDQTLNLWERYDAARSSSLHPINVLREFPTRRPADRRDPDNRRESSQTSAAAELDETIHPLIMYANNSLRSDSLARDNRNSENLSMYEENSQNSESSNDLLETQSLDVIHNMLRDSGNRLLNLITDMRSSRQERQARMVSGIQENVEEFDRNPIFVENFPENRPNFRSDFSNLMDFNLDTPDNPTFESNNTNVSNSNTTTTNPPPSNIRGTGLLQILLNNNAFQPNPTVTSNSNIGSANLNHASMSGNNENSLSSSSRDADDLNTTSNNIPSSEIPIDIDAPSTSNYQQSNPTGNNRSFSNETVSESSRSNNAFDRVTRGVQAIERHTEALIALWARGNPSLRRVREMWEDLRREILILQRVDTNPVPYYSISTVDAWKYIKGPSQARNSNRTDASRSNSADTSNVQQSNDNAPNSTTPNISEDQSPSNSVSSTTTPSNSTPSNSTPSDSTPSNSTPSNSASNTSHPENCPWRQAILSRYGLTKKNPNSKDNSSRNNNSTTENSNAASQPSTSNSQPTDHTAPEPPRNRFTPIMLRRCMAGRLTPSRSRSIRLQEIGHRRNVMNIRRGELEVTRDRIRMRARRVLGIMFSIMMDCLEADQLSNRIITMLRSLKKALSVTCLLLVAHLFSDDPPRSNLPSENNTTAPTEQESNETQPSVVPSFESELRSSLQTHNLETAINEMISEPSDESVSSRLQQQRNEMYIQIRRSRTLLRLHTMPRFRRRIAQSRNVQYHLANAIRVANRTNSDSVPSTSSLQQNLSSAETHSENPPTDHPTSRTNPLPERSMRTRQVRDLRRSPTRSLFSRPYFYRRFLFNHRLMGNMLQVLRRPESLQLSDLDPANRYPERFEINRMFLESSRRNMISENLSNGPQNVSVPLVQVNDVPISEMAQNAENLQRSHPSYSRAAEYLQPIFAAQNINSNEDNDSRWSTTIRYTTECPSSPVHRIQVWDFTQGQLPDIANVNKNIVVRKCKIHNDASIDISRDGRLLVALLPAQRMGNITHLLGIFSLEWSNLGECLYTTLLEQNAVSVSLSPCARHLAVGLGSRRVSLLPYERNGVMAVIFRLGSVKLKENDTRLGSLIPIRSLEQSWGSGFTSLNCLRWAPQPGQGLVYANNTGQLKILS